MTDAEIEIEWRYRYEERLGILTDGKTEPTPDLIAIATEEANEWALKWNQLETKIPRPLRPGAV